MLHKNLKFAVIFHYFDFLYNVEFYLKHALQY